MAKKKTSTKKKAAKKKPAKKASSKKAPRKLNKATLVRQWMGRVNHNKDHRTVAFGDEVPNTYLLRRPSGIMQLDIDTGGGAPAGGGIQITGPDNSGKTYLKYLYCAMHQRLYGDESAVAVALDEGGFDYMAARKAGFMVAVPEPMIEEMQEMRRRRAQPPLTPDELSNLRHQIGVFSLIQGNNGEEILQTVLEAVESMLFGIVAIDSISMLEPNQEAGKDMDDPSNVRAHASMMTNFWKKYLQHTNTLDGRNFTTLICINQIRAVQNIPSHMAGRVRKWEGGGANAAKHGKLIDIVLTKGEKIKRQVNKVKYIVGKMFKWELQKGKAGTHDNISGEAPFTYPEYGTFGVNCTDSLIVTGMRRGVLAEGQGGEVLLRPTNSSTGEVGEWMEIAPSVKILPDLFAADFDFELQVRREILADAGVECLYR